jgi:hypothetical protein
MAAAVGLGIGWSHRALAQTLIEHDAVVYSRETEQWEE